jgi:uncharacterized protein (TIGR04255 family)
MRDEVESELVLNRPPIVEAVIERRFTTPLTLEQMSALREKFERDYPAVSQLVEVQVTLSGQPGDKQAREAIAGYKLIDQEGTGIVLITTQAVSFARVAPYPGWVEFSGKASDIFRDARQTMGYSTIGRLGVRYINRLDIPFEEGEQVLRLPEYIVINVNYPEGVVPTPINTAIQCVTFLPAVQSSLTINVATVPSPVPNHRSFVFDIDIGRDIDVPQSEDEIALLLTSIRYEKNKIFRVCLTDKMMELFK